MKKEKPNQQENQIQENQENQELQSFENDLIPDDLEPPEKPTGKRGRPRKADKALEQKQSELAAIISMTLVNTVNIPFDILANRLGAHWKLGSNESKALSNSLEMLLEKYAPNLGSYSVEIFAIVSLSGILIPRILIQIQISKEKKENPDETTAIKYPQGN